MAWIIESLNPFEPLKADKHEVSGGTIRSWVECRHPQTKEFPSPTICVLNGSPLLRKDWDYEIREKDIVNFIAVQGGWEVLIYVVIAIVISLAVTLLTPVPRTPDTPPASDPVFSIKGQSNTIRLGEPIECNYGRNRIYPSFASAPYYEYHGNDQFQYGLFCLGQGYYDVNEIRIGDTVITSFQDVQYELIPPGGSLTLFPANVVTSIEVGGQELLNPNTPEYNATGATGPDRGWIGPFAANAPTTVATRLQVDLVWPRGMYHQDAHRFGSASFSLQIQYREIDDTGAPLSGWLPFDASWPPGLPPDQNVLYLTGNTTTPQRRTIETEVTSGRYEVRLRRCQPGNADPETSGVQIIWEGLRAWVTGTFHDYGDVTLLAVKIRANNNLNDRSSQKFNVIATRKLPIRESSGSWSAPVTTRSIVWSFVDVFRSNYGGRIFDEVFIDWDTLEALDSFYAGRGEYFDWIFRDPITVWDAARIIAKAGRGIPLLMGSLISLKRDGPSTIPTTLFNHENIVEGSFQWAVKLWDLDEFDSIRVEYTDPDTGYKQETVTAVLPGGTSDHPQDLRLMGVQSRAQAYHEGLYAMAVQLYLRENISFETGMEGFIPTYGDLIAVSHDVPKWGQAGYVVDAVRGASSAYHLWLSEPLRWDESNEYQIMLRTKTSDVLGPFTASRTSDPSQIIIYSVSDIDFLLTGKTEPMLFLFGVAGEITKLLKVVRVEPSGGERIKITCVNDNPLIHSFDGLAAPELGAPSMPPVAPDLPTINQLFIAPINGPLLTVQISWTAAFGAQSYVVQTSEDDENWTDRGRVARTSVQLQVKTGDLYVRVAAINTGQGEWISDHVVIGPLNALFLTIPWDEEEWEVSWLQVLNSAGWRVKVYDATGSAPVLKRTEDLSIADAREFLYNFTKATADSNLVREMIIEVDVLFASDTGPTPSGSPASLELSNTIPPPPTNLTYSFDSGDVLANSVDYLLAWTVPAVEDLIRVKVWVSPTNNFNPSLTIPVYDYTAAAPGSAGIPTSRIVTVALDSSDDHPAMYWRVGLFDCWGNEISTNVSEQKTIPSFNTP